jgi:hypothetical protein
MAGERRAKTRLANYCAEISGAEVWQVNEGVWKLQSRRFAD